MNKSSNSRSSLASMAVILTLFLLLTTLSGAVILSGNNIYKKIADSMGENYEKRISLSYLATKIRQNDVQGSIYTEMKDDVKMLAIREDSDGFEFVTYLYYYDGYIREIFLDIYEGTVPDFKLSDGDPIVSTGGFDFQLYTDCILLSIKNRSGDVQNLTIALRAS